MMRIQGVIRFHLDENVHHAIAHALKLRGVDVTTTTDVNLVAASDEDQLAFAMSSERVLFTHDADFLRPDIAGRNHHGIVYSPKNAHGIGEIVRYLVLLAQSMEANELRGRVEFF